MADIGRCFNLAVCSFNTITLSASAGIPRGAGACPFHPAMGGFTPASQPPFKKIMSDPQIKVIRQIFYPDSCIGSLLINGGFECFTLEDTDRQLEHGGIKVPGKTAIPRGTYQVSIDWSNRFKRMMPHILNVMGFEGIRIHWGNYAKDTEGCILLGEKINDDSIMESKIAFNIFFSKLESLLATDRCWIRIA